MIDLTPLEVRKKKGDFRKAMRGYDPQAVDDFLDLVADRLEQLVRENMSLTEKVSSVGSQVSEYRDRERALTEALVTAQEMRTQMRQQIEREVDLKRREAEAEAEGIRNAVAAMREREEENIRRLRARQTQFVQSYRAFLERELAEIGVMAQTLDLSTQEDAEAPAPRKRTKKADGAQAPASPEPIPMPLPVAIPEPEAPRKEEVGRVQPLRADTDDSFDLNIPLKPFPYDLPPAAPKVPPAPPPAAQLKLDELALADEAPELELLDEVEEEEEPRKKKDDSDGWVSTLLEGKGD